MSTQRTARLRVCASCEWVFRGSVECPKCGFGSYGARWVYGNAAYTYERTQQPWRDKKLAAYGAKLDNEIKESVPCKAKPALTLPGL